MIPKWLNKMLAYRTLAEQEELLRIQGDIALHRVSLLEAQRNIEAMDALTHALEDQAATLWNLFLSYEREETAYHEEARKHYQRAVHEVLFTPLGEPYIELTFYISKDGEVRYE